MTEISAAVAASAAAKQLGAVTRIFPPGSKRLALLGTACFALLFGGFATAVDIALVATANDGKVGPPTAVLIVLNVLGILAVGGFIAVLASSPRRRIYLFSNGFVQVSRRGPDAVRWDEVVLAYYHKVKTRGGTMRSYRLTASGGRKYVVDDNVVTMTDFAPELFIHVAQAQLPRALAAITQGKAADFGPIIVTWYGISVKGKAEVPWSQVTDIEFDGSHVVVSENGKRRVVPAAEVPNIGALIEVAKTKVVGVSQALS